MLRNLQRLLDSGESPKLDVLGGLQQIRANAVSISASPLLSVFVDSVLSASVRDVDAIESQTIVAELVQNASDPVAIREAYDVWGSWCETTDNWGTLYKTAIRYATDDTRDTFSRVGALEWGTVAGLAGAPPSKFSMIGELLKVEHGGNQDFDRHLAVVLGICFDAFPQKELADRIRTLTESNENPEANFELGFVYLRHFLEAQTRDDATNYQLLARHQFARVIDLTEGWPEAHLFAKSLDVLQSFAAGETAESIRDLTDQIDVSLFELSAYHRSETDSPWLKARSATATLWADLAAKLRGLTKQLDQPAWYPADVVIRDQLLPLYTASRTIFRQTLDSCGVEILVSARIEAGVAANEAHVHLLAQFLERDATDDERVALKSLVGAVPSASMPESHDRKPSPELLLGHLQMKHAERQRIVAALYALMEIRHKNLSAAAAEKLAHVLTVFGRSPDFHSSKDIANLAQAVAMMTIQFLKLRLDASPKSAAYLFVDEARGRSLERELQDDYFNWMASGLGGTSIEVENVGGGRADVHFRLGSENLVTEVKREHQDASFEALELWYANQTMAYQQTSSRIGVLLVLDQVKRDGPPPHLTELVKARSIRIAGTDDVRTIMMVRVPGERMTPSQLSKVEKTGGLPALQEKKKALKGRLNSGENAGSESRPVGSPYNGSRQ